MKRIHAILIAGLVTAGLAAAQPKTIPAVFSYSNLKASSETITLQQPASGARTVQLLKAYVYCSAACIIEQFRNGTAATATSGTAAKQNPEASVNPTATVWRSSDTNTASAEVLPVIELTAAGSTTLDFNDDADTGTVYLVGSGTTKNYTIKVTITGTTRISLVWREFPN